MTKANKRSSQAETVVVVRGNRAGIETYHLKSPALGVELARDHQSSSTARKTFSETVIKDGRELSDYIVERRSSKLPNRLKRLLEVDY